MKKGAVIARISLRPNMLNVNQAEAQLLSARTSLQKQAADQQRYQKLREQRLISDIEFNQHATDFKLQQEAVQAAEDTLLLLKTGQTRNASNVSNMIPATIDGTSARPEYKEGAFFGDQAISRPATTIALRWPT